MNNQFTMVKLIFHLSKILITLIFHQVDNLKMIIKQPTCIQITAAHPASSTRKHNISRLSHQKQQTLNFKEFWKGILMKVTKEIHYNGIKSTKWDILLILWSNQTVHPRKKLSIGTTTSTTETTMATSKISRGQTDMVRQIIRMWILTRIVQGIGRHCKPSSSQECQVEHSTMNPVKIGTALISLPAWSKSLTDTEENLAGGQTLMIPKYRAVTCRPGTLKLRLITNQPSSSERSGGSPVAVMKMIFESHHQMVHYNIL